MSTTTTGTREVKPTTNPPSENSNTSLVVALIVLGILMIAAFGIGYMYWEENETMQTEIFKEREKAKEIEDIKKKLDEELESSRAELNSYMNRNVELDELLKNANKKLNARQKQINRLAKEKANITAYKQQLEEMSEENEEFRAKIAAFTTEVEQLKSENSQLKTTIATLESEKASLTTKVNSANSLQAYSIKAETMQQKKGDKYVFTNRAKRTDRISISFELPDNPLAEKGSKDVHLLIISPNGNILSDASSSQPTFTKMPDNKESAFTRHKAVDYTGTKQKVFFNWDKSKGYLTGNYKVEIYLDGSMIGSTAFTIR